MLYTFILLQGQLNLFIQYPVFMDVQILRFHQYSLNTNFREFLITVHIVLMGSLATNLCILKVVIFT